MTGERDPRAHWLDDDPFDKRSPQGSHSAARDDGNWRRSEEHTSELQSQ